MRWTRLIVGLCLALALLAPVTGGAGEHLPPGAGAPDGGPPLDPAPSSTIPGAFRTWTGEPTGRPLELAYSHNELIVMDNPYDDRGADTDLDDGRTLNPGEYDTLLRGANAGLGSAGDYAYPSDAAYARNAADIVETRVAADAAAWYLLVVLNTLVDPERTAIEARIDGHTLVVHGDTGLFDSTLVDAKGDASRNTYEVKIPRSLYDPGTEVKKLFVASGLWNPAAGTWHDPDTASNAPPFFDLAYDNAEGMDSYWRDKRQSSDIAMSSFAIAEFSVNFACLSITACDTIHSETDTVFTRVFRSGQPLGEGVSPQTRYGQESSGFGWNVYKSAYQPYAVYRAVPATISGAQPLVILLHFLGGNHMSYPLTSWPNMKRWADDLGAIVVMPLARGEAGWYEAEAEKDVFEVWRDVASHYDVDRERVYLAGMSMGGFGTWRLGLLYPHLFAKTMVWSGPMTPYSLWPYPAEVTTPQANPPACDRDAPGCGYNLMDLFGNGRNLPYFVVHGGLDELVPSTGAQEWMNEYDSLHWSPYRYVLYPGRRHETSYPGSTAHFVTEWFGELPVRQRAPSYVSYKVIRDLQQPSIGITYDRAYWVHGLTLATGDSEGKINADRQHRLPLSTRLDARYGVDGLGPYQMSGRDVRPDAGRPNLLHLTLNGLATASIDTSGLGWTYSDNAFVFVTTDRQVTVRIAGAFPGALGVAGPGGAFPFTRDGSDIVLDLAPGEYSLRVEPA